MKQYKQLIKIELDYMIKELKTLQKLKKVYGDLQKTKK